jgi:phosphate transport system substrate-binding protein
MGGVVPVINMPGIAAGQVKLTGALLADIYMGKIKKWNDAALVALNPELKDRDDNIAVVRRADGSGTTFIFTNYLSKVSGDWQSKVGSGTIVAWPEGLGGKGNEGVSSYVSRIKGAIGYVEYAYAKKANMTHVQMQNLDGAFVQPNMSTFQAAATYADWTHAPAFYEVLTNEPGKNSWPLTGATFVLMHKSEDKAAQAKQVLNFFDWAFKNGQKQAAELDYVALPDNLVKMIASAWHANIKDSSGKAIW